MRKHSRIVSLLLQRCPRCLYGKIFETLLETRATCPHCAMQFRREEGYYLGAMYFSYALGIAFLSLFFLIWYLVFPQWDINRIGLLSLGTFLPLVPATYRYSRVLWIYFDRWAWPGEED